MERAEYIAGYLRKEFVENRTGLVAIRMKKSVNQIAAVMGVLIAGFSYLPIDIKQPLARQEKILSKANVIVELDEKKVNMIGIPIRKASRIPKSYCICNIYFWLYRRA